MSKLAILQMSDTPQIESSAHQLRLAGYEVAICGDELRTQLQAAGCRAVLPYRGMLDAGYDKLNDGTWEAGPQDMQRCSLFCEIKVGNLDLISQQWPHLRNKLCWWRVNGAMPEYTPHGGDETDPPYPVVGANLWYREPIFNRRGKNHVFYPPYPRMDDYLRLNRSSMRASSNFYDPPFCLCHGFKGWGYNACLPRMVEQGIRVFGMGAPDGIIPHKLVPRYMEQGLAMAHMKGSDCPGWALYEALLAGCPIVMPRLLVTRSHMEDLFIDGQTYLGVGPVGTGDGKVETEHDRCMDEAIIHLEALRDPHYNQKIGLAGRNKLMEVMWRADRDLPAFCEWLAKEFKER